MSEIINLSPRETKDLIDNNISNKDFIILDLRSKAAFQKKHIQNAVHLDYHADDFDDNLENLDISKTYLIYCDGNAKANITSEMLQDLGAKNIYKLDGGMIRLYNEFDL
ncbi:MAG: rhodanese-like domain-containing protein [Candidatus Cloacimonetes bacterium]|nr:rhodanese-like domain-containing protein [Candidatus Cloacimonadota bacterium]